MLERKKVFVHLESSRGYGRDLLKGIYEYNSRVTNWEIVFEPAYYLQSGFVRNNIEIIKAVKPDGCILEYQENIEELVKMGIPVIQTTSMNPNPSVLCLQGNFEEDGAMAYNYFTGLGFSKLGFFGVDYINFSRCRYESFQRNANLNNIDVHAHILLQRDAANRYQENFGKLIKWVKSLPTPIGILACNDDFGQTLIHACSMAGVKVPYEVAVLGVDNDELLCNISVPNLSSISRNLMSTSSEICSSLDKMMRGEAVHKRFIQTNPSEVIVRQSTDTVATDDKEVAKAIVFISENLDKPITVQDVVEATALSRRSLYSRFSVVTGCTIHEEIQSRKLRRFKRLLKDTRLSVKEIGFQIGFEDVAHVSRWFSSLERKSPSQWRVENS